MAHMVNKAHTRWLAANLTSGHLAHAGNHRHGAAGHSHGWCSAQRAAVLAKGMASGQGVVVTDGYRSCPVMQCGASVTTALTHIHIRLHQSAHRPWEVSSSSYAGTRSQHGLATVSRCSQRGRKDGLILPSGCMKADIGSQVASDSP